MKKLVLLLLFISPSVFAGTATDIPTIRTVAQQLAQQTGMLNVLAQNLGDLNSNGFLYTIPGSTVTIQLQAADQANLLSYYALLKAHIIATVQQLP